MAITINVAGSYNDKDIKRAQRDLEKLGAVAGDQSKSIVDSMDRLASGMIDVGETMTKKVTLPIVGAGAAMFAAFTRQEDAEARLNAVIKATGGVAGVTAEHVLDLASSLQQTTTFGDEATIAAASLLLTFKDVTNAAGEGNDVFDRTVKVGQDMAALMGTDLDSALMQLGKALNDPADGLSRLQRVGVNFTEQQKEQIKAMVESGDVMGAQKVMLGEIESQFGGTAEAMAQTSSGKIKQAFNDLGDVAEDFGEIIARSIDKVSGFLRDLAQRFQNLSPETKELIVTIAAVAAAIGPLLLIGGKMIKLVLNIVKVVKLFNLVLMANPIGLVVGALIALGALLFLAYQRFEGFRNVVDQAFNVIKDVIAYAWDNVIKPIFEAIVEALQEHLMPVVQRVWDAFQDAWPGIQSAIETAWGVISPILQRLIQIIVQIYSNYLKALIKVISTVFNTAITVIRTAWNIIGAIFRAINSFIQNILVPVFRTIGSVAGTVWRGISGAVDTAWGIIKGIFDSLRNAFGNLKDFFSTTGDTIKGVFSSIGDGIKSAFRGAFNFVARAWNNTVGKINFTLPSNPLLGPLSGFNVSVPNIPEFAKGGIVPGILGDPMLAIVHGGEQILRPSEVAGGAGATGDTYNITINGMVGRDKREVLDYLARELPKVAVRAGRSQG